MLIRLCLLVLMLCLPLRASADVSYSKVMCFRIGGEAGKVQLSSRVSVQQTFISPRSTRRTTFRIYEYPHVTVSNIRAVCRREPLDSRKITYHYPQSGDYFIEASRVHEIEYPQDLKPGDSISYTYDEVYEDAAFFPLIEVPALDQLERFEVIVEHPIGFQVDFQVFHAHETLQPQVDRTAPDRTRIVFENLPRPRALAADPFEDLQACILTKISRAGSPVNPFTPAAFTRWYLDLLEPTSVPDDRMKALLAEDLARVSSKLEKARVLFDFVKTQIRYVADEGKGHAFLPHPCSEVLDKRWGDCKDKARLLVVLGRLHDIPIHMALLSTHPAPTFSEVNLHLFNHAICVLDDGHDPVFMDPTDPHSEMGDPPVTDQLAEALILNPEHPRYARVSSRGPGPDVELHLEGELTSLKAGKARLVLRHSWRSSVLQARQELSALEFESYLVRRMERLLLRLPLERLELVREDRRTLVLDAAVDMSSFFVVTDARIYAPTAPFRVIDADWLEREKDPYAVKTSGLDRLKLTLELAAPGLQARPDRVVIGDGGGPAHSADSVGVSERIKLAYAFEQPFRLVPSGSRASFLKFCSEYLQLDRKLFVFQRSHP